MITRTGPRLPLPESGSYTPLRFAIDPRNAASPVLRADKPETIVEPVFRDPVVKQPQRLIAGTFQQRLLTIVVEHRFLLHKDFIQQNLHRLRRERRLIYI